MIIPKATELIELKRSSLRGLVDDLTKLDELNVPLIMHCLRERAKRKSIYTNVGTILISINPYELLPLYTPQVMDKYKRRGEGDAPPHPFAIADECYRSLFEDRKNQSILVSFVDGLLLLHTHLFVALTPLVFTSQGRVWCRQN
jgi:myosin heavy subunit